MVFNVRSFWLFQFKSNPLYLIDSYNVTYTADNMNSWNSSAANITIGNTTYFIPEDGRVNLTFSIAGNGGISTADQPCFFLDVTGDHMVEYGEYFLSNNTATTSCPSDTTNRPVFCNANTFTYLCDLTKVAEPTASTRSR